MRRKNDFFHNMPLFKCQQLFPEHITKVSHIFNKAAPNHKATTSWQQKNFLTDTKKSNRVSLIKLE